MKIQITFKTPDALEYAIQDNIPYGISTDEASDFRESVTDVLNNWVKYGEQVRIEFDTDLGTATVLPCK